MQVPGRTAFCVKNVLNDEQSTAVRRGQLEIDCAHAQPVLLAEPILPGCHAQNGRWLIPV
jgi:hypothetical protein